jgi:hypothetical protein
MHVSFLNCNAKNSQELFVTWNFPESLARNTEFYINLRSFSFFLLATAGSSFDVVREHATYPSAWRNVSFHPHVPGHQCFNIQNYTKNVSFYSAVNIKQEVFS